MLGDIGSFIKWAPADFRNDPKPTWLRHRVRSRLCGIAVGGCQRQGTHTHADQRGERLALQI